MPKAGSNPQQPGDRLQLKVTLLDLRPAIWRRLLVPAAIKLPKFHTVLQLAFGWTNSHLHAFRHGEDSYETDHRSGWVPDLFNDGSGHDEKKVRLGDLLQARGDWLLYEYDFGDSWEHEVLIEKVLPGTGTSHANWQGRKSGQMSPDWSPSACPPMGVALDGRGGVGIARGGVLLQGIQATSQAVSRMRARNPAMASTRRSSRGVIVKMGSQLMGRACPGRRGSQAGVKRGPGDVRRRAPRRVGDNAPHPPATFRSLAAGQPPPAEPVFCPKIANS